MNLSINACRIAPALAILLAAAPAVSKTYSYSATLVPVANNNATAGATSTYVYDDMTDILTVTIDAYGLDDGSHAQHVHGLVNPFGDSVPPTLSDDADMDGYVELAEGVPSYGAVILPLTYDDGSFPVSNGGTYSFMEDYDLSDPTIYGFTDGSMTTRFTKADLAPTMLQFRETVIHGQNVPMGAGAGTDGEVNGTGGFIALLPTASKDIMKDGSDMSAVPVPAAGLMLIAGLGGLGFARKRRN